MDWYNNYKTNLISVFTMAEQQIATFPQPLHTMGLAFADKFNPVKHDSGKDYICTLLPFWIKEWAGINDLQCEQLALANVYGMLYFFIQDEVMDSRQPSGDWKEQLALGNLLLLEMFKVFRTLFPSDSVFWSYYDGYTATWADSVVNENRLNYFVNDLLHTAGKASPVKIASTGALLLTGREQLIPAMENAVDIALATLQMADDWADWREDFADGSYNGLIAMIAAGRSSDAKPLTEKDIENAIYIRCCMNAYTAIARNNHDKLITLGIEANELIDFHTYILNHLNHIAETIDTNMTMRLKGGFHYFLSTKAIIKGH